MKKTTLFLLVTSLLIASGCHKKQYLPEAENDKIYTTVGGKEKLESGGIGYTISVPEKSFRYEKDFEDGNLEEKWEYNKKDDVQIKVTTYKDSDEATARRKFLKENDDYIFEDLMGYPVCGTELDGDTIWFSLHQSGNSVYIVSWEYPKNTEDSLKKELSDIAETFKLSE